MTDKIQQWASKQAEQFRQFSMFETDETSVSNDTTLTPAYYNTTKLSGSELSERIAKAENQDEVILGLFQRFDKLTPSECLEKYIEVTRLTPPPITSIRRAINTLTKSGKLWKLEAMKRGMYGSPEHYWRVVK